MKPFLDLDLDLVLASAKRVVRCGAGVAVLSALACGGSTDDGGTGSGGSPGSGGDGSGTLSCADAADSDPITIDGVSLDGDELVVSVSHGGGCAEHAYDICFSDSWAESDPVQVDAQIIHDDGGDSCEALLTEDLRFDLAGLRADYEERYQQSSGRIEISVDGKSVIYSFGDAVVTMDEIEAQAEALNSCEVVEDCKAISVGCSSVWVNVNADTSELEAEIDAYVSTEFGELGPLCPASCACGVLTCSESKCTPESGDCGEPPEGSLSICL